MHPWSNAAVLASDPDGFLDRITMMGMCLVSSGLVPRVGESFLRELTDATPLASTMRRRLAAHLGCDDDRAAVSAARHAAYSADPAAYLDGLWSACGLAGLVCDEGYPQPPVDFANFRTEARVPVHRVFRIEPVITKLRETAASYEELEDALAAACEEAAAADAVAFKTVLAYRTGLDVGEPTRGRRQGGLPALARRRLPGDARRREAGARPPAGARDGRRQGHRPAAARALRRRRRRRGARPLLGPRPVPVPEPPPRAPGGADPLRPAVAGGGRLRGADPAPRLPRAVDHDAVVVAGARQPARAAARRGADQQGALRLRRVDRPRGALAVGAGRARGAGARADAGAASAAGSTTRRP